MCRRCRSLRAKHFSQTACDLLYPKSCGSMNPDTHPQSLRSEYREFPAPLGLSDYFLCFWTQTISGTSGEYTQQVLPDGCVDIIFINQDPPVAVGPWTNPFAANFSAGTRILGARFHPGRAPGLLG